MGNQQSQDDVPEAVASGLSPKARRRISKSPFIQNFIEQANRTSNAPRNMPSLTSTWCETSSPTYSQRQRTSVKKASPQQKNGATAKTATTTITTAAAQPLATQNPNQQIVTQQTTTTRKPSGNPKAPYYIVSTTTYYVKGPSSRPNSSDGGVSLSGQDPRRLSSISHVPSQTSSSNASTFSDSDDILYRLPRGIEYTTVEGRKFMTAPGLPYKMVCDDDESDRLVILHFLLKYAFNGNVVAPINDILTKGTLCNGKTKRPQVVDVGCGPGTWVLEMATEFPNTDFHGVDICPMFPGTIKPSNSFFRQQNILDGLPYPDNSIDFLHVRLMLASMTQEQVLKMLGETMRVLKPGAYVELRDVEYRVQRPGPVTDALINQKLYDIFEKSYDIKLDLGHHMSTLLMMSSKQDGFVDVHQDKTTIPIGWGGQLGEIHSQNLDIFLKSLDPKIREATTTQSQISDWEPAGMENKTTMLTDSAIEHMMRECEKYQSHMNWFVCYGRKPATSGPPAVVVASPPEAITITPAVPAVGVEAAASPPIEEGAWASINDFADGYVD
ncbi:hypothetical protein BDB00DRAFT_868680 [Zychaea mexicana]|uniref:uncharacterized protein n=1 Tax=Zychaea mexicana TaxID=64656 RepID=UPI0022FF3169|nr:uncharacterized protein BDB00DRAFT_868680 [Zychaea mexicana]KAI9497227.1 hypothetical protein BDB00DRAFT_868680 [Zychaea mexicana]